MPELDPKAGLFPALLKHWRNQRGLSQLDLALAADVSGRHVSFIETGKSSPSAEMVVRLATALDVPLRHINAMLRAAGHAPVFGEPRLHDPLPDWLTNALQMMKAHHDPFPLIVLDRTYDVIDANRGGAAMIEMLGASPEMPINLLRFTFDAQGARSAIVNFDEVGRSFLWRVQHEVLAKRNDPLQRLLEEVMSWPTVSDDWRKADLTDEATAAVVIHLRIKGHDLRFVVRARRVGPGIATRPVPGGEAWFGAGQLLGVHSWGRTGVSPRHAAVAA